MTSSNVQATGDAERSVDVDQIVLEATAMVFELETSDIRQDHDFEIDFGATSMMLMDLGVALERKLDIQFTALDFVDTRNVRQLSTLVRKRLARKQ